MNLVDKLKSKKETLKTMAIIGAVIAFLVWFLTSTRAYRKPACGTALIRSVKCPLFHTCAPCH